MCSAARTPRTQRARRTRRTRRNERVQFSYLEQEISVAFFFSAAVARLLSRSEICSRVGVRAACIDQMKTVLQWILPADHVHHTAHAALAAVMRCRTTPALSCPSICDHPAPQLQRSSAGPPLNTQPELIHDRPSKKETAACACMVALGGPLGLFPRLVFFRPSAARRAALAAASAAAAAAAAAPDFFCGWGEAVGW